MTHVETKRAIEVNAQLTRWFVSFAEFSCFVTSYVVEYIISDIRVANTVDAVTKIDFEWPGHNGSSLDPKVVNPGDTINCSANGRPTPTFTTFNW